MSDTRRPQPGLKLRMRGGARRISSQHRQLDALYAQILDALAEGARDDAARALERFLDAWDAHTSLEDGFYFPALRGLRPAIAGQLAAFAAAHRRYHEMLQRVEVRIAEGDLEETLALLEEIAEEIARHEQDEEQLVAELTGEPGEPGDGVN